MIKKMFTNIVKAGALGFALIGATAQAYTIDILVLYDQETLTHYGTEQNVNAKVLEWISEVNTAYQNSGVNLTLNKVGLAYRETQNFHPHTVLGDINSSTQVASLRSQYGADFVTQISNFTNVSIAVNGSLKHGAWGAQTTSSSEADFRNGTWSIRQTLYAEGYAIASKTYRPGRCSISASTPSTLAPGSTCTNYTINFNTRIGGAGYTSVLAANAFSVVDMYQGGFNLAHELGHNMGLYHDRVTDPTGSNSYYAYGRGYGVNSLFTTIMGYESSFNASTIGYFSNPDKYTCMGQRCGVPSYYSDSANSVLAINNKASNFASFRPTAAPTPPPPSQCTINVGSCSSGSCAQSFGMACSSAGGSTSTQNGSYVCNC